MNTLGVYLGPEMISICESNGKKLINTINIPQKNVTESEFEEKVPEDIKIVALFKDEIRKSSISAKEVGLTLSGKDLIIRTFEMPSMPAEDLVNAISFEAKKYMPFKIEELVLDYQVYTDRANRKNIVLIVGIKKEVLDKYVSIFQQLNLKIISLEYAAFSVFRLLKLAGVHDKGNVAVIEADIREMDEVNFMVLENDFPLFSRDIILTGGPQGGASEEDKNPEKVLDKLKTEIRVSLDYYHRKFPGKSINKLLFVSNKEYKTEFEAFTKDIGLSNFQLIDAERFMGGQAGFSLSSLKSYSVSLAKAVNVPTKIDLIAAKARQLRKAATSARKTGSLFEGLRIEPPVIVLSLMICVAAFLFGMYQRLPLQKEIMEIKAVRPQVSTVNPDSDYPTLEGIDLDYKVKLARLDSLVKKQLFLTSPLNAIPRCIPEGIWLRRFSFSSVVENNKLELQLQGTAYVGDSNKEIGLINEFINKLRNNAQFSAYFKEISLGSIDQEKFDKVNVTSFSVTCKN